MDIKKLHEMISKALDEDNFLLKVSDELSKRLTFGCFYPETEAKLPKFNSLDALKKFIKDTNSFPDNFFYKGGLFTQDEYDMEGIYLTYASPELNIGIRVETPNNRYEHKGNYKALEINIEEDENPSFRFDLTYYLPNEVYKKLNSDKSLKEYYNDGEDNSVEALLAFSDHEELIDSTKDFEDYLCYKDGKGYCVTSITFEYEKPQINFQTEWFDTKEKALNSYKKDFLGESLKEGYSATKDMLEREAAEQFQPFITFEEYKEGDKRNSYMIWGTNLIYVDEHGGQSEILTGSTKTVLLNKIRAIRKYKEEIDLGRNKI